MRVLSEQAEIEVPSSWVWSALADFGGVDAWAPNMRSCELSGDQSFGIGARRRMRHAWGFLFEEVVTDWREGEGLSFDVLSAPYPMTQVRESWHISDQGSSTLVVTRVEYTMQLSVLGRALDRHVVQHIVRREMKSGLRGLAAHVRNGGCTRLSTN